MHFKLASLPVYFLLCENDYWGVRENRERIKSSMRYYAADSTFVSSVGKEKILDWCVHQGYVNSLCY